MPMIMTLLEMLQAITTMTARGAIHHRMAIISIISATVITVNIIIIIIISSISISIIIIDNNTITPGTCSRFDCAIALRLGRAGRISFRGQAMDSTGVVYVGPWPESCNYCKDLRTYCFLLDRLRLPQAGLELSGCLASVFSQRKLQVSRTPRCGARSVEIWVPVRVTQKCPRRLLRLASYDTKPTHR